MLCNSMCKKLFCYVYLFCNYDLRYVNKIPTWFWVMKIEFCKRKDESSEWYLSYNIELKNSDLCLI